ncbi:hypothetical protein RB195_017168 [Necator americanus]|uniref:Uncharacterized protein n=2 Tax=Necator americanus TaxID=51031 RepID=W2SW34_NECAM|nr:hypothetical protein NECAME_04180 [Necator americanus]ETN73959.1 hypothetical protein NECAME_04180 [Necator americanus]
MVCVPCIFLPILLAIYLKFIQPYVLRFLPERWVTFLDPYLYPTCPAKPPPQVKQDSNESESAQSCPCAKAEEDSKKDR